MDNIKDLLKRIESLKATNIALQAAYDTEHDRARELETCKNQLTEARTEVERWKKFYPNHATAKESGRQDAAKEICDYLWNSSVDDELSKGYVIDAIKAKFKLEG